MNDAKLSLSDAAKCGAHNNNTYLNIYLMSLRIGSFTEKHINMTRTNILRTMKFFAENNDIESFDPERLLEIELRYAFYETLKDIGISCDTVAKYFQALSKMVDFEANSSPNKQSLPEAFRLALTQVGYKTKTRFTKTT